MLDNRTILFVLIMIGFLSTLYSFFPTRKTGDRSMNMFRAANIAYLAGFGLLSLQGRIPPFFSMVISNTFILTAFALFSYTVNMIYKADISRKILYCIYPLHLLLFIIFTLFYPITFVRIVIISLGIMLFMTVSLVKLRKSRILRKTAIFRMVILTQAGYLFFHMFRIIQTSQFFFNIESIFNENFPTAIIFLSSMSYHISMNLLIIITRNRQYAQEALDRVRLLEQTHAEMSRINSIPFSQSADQNGDDLYTSISNFILQYFGAAGIAIHLYNPERNELQLVFVSEKMAGVRELAGVLPIRENFITGRAFIRREPVFITVDQYPNAEILERLHNDKITEAASFPISSHSGTIGTFTMIFENEVHLIKDNYDIFKLVSIQIGSIIENSELSRMLLAQASTDPLTGIANRREFLKRLNEEFSRAQRHGTALSLLMLDIDHFKKINDTYGHDAGDYVLKEMSRIIRSDLRAEDLFGRYGGEEFLILLGNCSLKEAEELAERYRKKIESSEMKFRNTPIRITISIGGTELVPGDSSGDVLITRSDTLLYEAKNCGRNKCVLRV